MNLIDAQNAASQWVETGEVAVPWDHLWRYRMNIKRLHPPPPDPVLKATIADVIDQYREALDRLADM